MDRYFPVVQLDLHVEKMGFEESLAVAAVKGGSPSDGDRSRPVPAVILRDNYGGPDTVEASAHRHGEVGGGKTQQSSAGIAMLDDAGDNLVL
ncbi:hypothetical protein FHX80_111705 [Streptomyces brevispora]|uniref:Uncharacterized protein n=1 Tax=Streptomyces brevispora TaxID=887462 RepID=A0A561UV99_9ACTN|nr:hypothetical protein FHX80_111705 [Streptomyces brevispora]